MLHQTKSIGYLSPELEQLHKTGRNPGILIDFSQVFISAIRNFDCSIRVLGNEDPLVFLLPVLRIHTSILCGDLANEDKYLRIGLRKVKEMPLTQVVGTVWENLRMLRHDAAQPFKCFYQYDVDRNNSRTQGQEDYLRLVSMFDRVLVQLERTEQLARDYLQAHVARLSLEESRASIKQSKIALEESKRTKLSKPSFSCSL